MLSSWPWWEANENNNADTYISLPSAGADWRRWEGLSNMNLRTSTVQFWIEFYAAGITKILCCVSSDRTSGKMSCSVSMGWNWLIWSLSNKRYISMMHWAKISPRVRLIDMQFIIKFISNINNAFELFWILFFVPELDKFKWISLRLFE